ncbi:MAG: hypothetical protein QW275_01470 [Candidatus Anstonellaceae archaeon]
MLDKTRFDHAFQIALFAVGFILISFGAVFAFSTLNLSSEQQSFEDALSFGFNSIFFSIFSGVMIGVGASLFINGLILAFPGSKAHMVLAFFFFILSVLVSASTLSNLTTFYLLVVFFAGMASAGAFLLSTIIFGMSGLLRLYLSRKK